VRNEPIHRFGAPDIMNTDQGSQFTSFVWSDRLKRAGCRISMDGKGRCIDNVFIERLWRSLKFECVYLHAWETGSPAKTRNSNWMTFFNHRQTRSPLDGTLSAVSYQRAINANQPNQQVQKIA
jgi:putative transposase